MKKKIVGVLGLILVIIIAGCVKEEKINKKYFMVVK